MRQLFTRDQNDTEINNYRLSYAFNNEQSPLRIVSCERSRNDNVKQITRKPSGLIYVKKVNEKQICNT